MISNSPETSQPSAGRMNMRSAFAKQGLRLVRWAGIAVAVVALLAVATWLGTNIVLQHLAEERYEHLGPRAPFLMTASGAKVRDLNKNGHIDPFEDPSTPTDMRVEDLLRQMSLEEKAGLLFIDRIPVGADGQLVDSKSVRDTITLVTPSSSDLLLTRHLSHFNITAAPDEKHWVDWYNRLQILAERTRLGIPVTIASDPRHSGGSSLLTGEATRQFSQWPEPTGIAATGDDEIARAFGNAVREEYRAMGIQLALHPMADVASEPRWPRVEGSFGEDPGVVSRMVRAYIVGLQGDKLSPSSVLSMVKHFPGGGPQLDGNEPHFAWGKDQAYPTRDFADHRLPFRAAFSAGAGAVMMSYGVPHGLSNSRTGAAFDKSIVTGLLRDQEHYEGIICSDWGVVTSTRILGLFNVLPARAWGVEHLDEVGRVEQLLDAGIDLIGGEHNPDWIVNLVRTKRISETRIDQSVRRLLKAKFQLGLFDSPYIDLDTARSVVGRADLVAEGLNAQRKSMVLLKAGSLPLKRGLKLYIENINPSIASRYGTLVARSEDADVALVRLETPFVPRSGLMESFFHGGDLDFKGRERARLLALMRQVPTVVDIHLQRPAVIPELKDGTLALTASFGSSDTVFLELVFGEFVSTGRLPFELPSSMIAVREQKPDRPHDSKNPLYPIGWRDTLAFRVANPARPAAK